VAIYVSDDGVGVPEPYRDKIFGIFERLGAHEGGEGGGTGIGLAMCRKIVEQDGGQITVSGPDDDIDPPGRAPAGGATFRIVYPASVLRPTPGATPIPSHGASR